MPIAKRAVSTPEGVVAINPPPRRGEGSRLRSIPNTRNWSGRNPRSSNAIATEYGSSPVRRERTRSGGHRWFPWRVDPRPRRTVGCRGRTTSRDHDFFNERIKFGGVKIGDVRGEVARPQSAGIEAREWRGRSSRARAWPGPDRCAQSSASTVGAAISQNLRMNPPTRRRVRSQATDRGQPIARVPRPSARHFRDKGAAAGLRIEFAWGSPSTFRTRLTSSAIIATSRWSPPSTTMRGCSTRHRAGGPPVRTLKSSTGITRPR